MNSKRGLLREPGIAAEELRQMYEYAQRWGPSNNWSGTTGRACAYVRILLDELERIREEVNKGTSL